MEMISAAVMLFFIMDPLGNIPIFQSILKGFSPRQSRRIIIRELLFAYIILCAFLFAGQSIMGFLGLKQAALSIAGGIVLFLIALRMVFPEHGLKTDLEKEDPFIVPLAVPMVAGPSSIAVLLLFSSKHPEKIWEWFAALSGAWFITALILLSSTFFLKLLGSRGLRAIEKLMGMLLIMMSVQMLLDGIKSYFVAS